MPTTSRNSSPAPRKRAALKAKPAAAKRPVKRATAAPRPAPDIATLAKRVRADAGGEYVHVLQVPYEARLLASKAGASWNALIRQTVYVGPVLPRLLQEYRARDNSLESWTEQEINGVARKPATTVNAWTPREHQLKGITRIRGAATNGWRGFVLADDVGLGKGLAASTLLPTPTGFVTMESLQEGSEVLSPEGTPTKVLAKYESQAKSFYRITFSDGATVDADEDHRWMTSSYKERRRNWSGSEDRMRLSAAAARGVKTLLVERQAAFAPVRFTEILQSADGENVNFLRALLQQVKPVGKDGKKFLYHPQEVLESLDRMLPSGNRWNSTAAVSSVKTTSEILSDQEESRNSGRRNDKHSIQVTKPIAGFSKQLPVDPYVLGTWLGDGNSHNGTLTSMDPEIAEKVGWTYPVRNIAPNGRTRARAYTFEGFHSALRQLYGLKGRRKIPKVIPAEYLNSSIEQRLELLRGLMDTDGSIGLVDQHGGVTFAQKDPVLFFQVYSLICSLGWKATWRSRQISTTILGYQVEGTYYELLFFPSEQVFYLARKATLLEERLGSFRSNAKHQLRYVVKVEQIEKSEPYYCISVDAPSHMYLCTESYVPTHNTLTALIGANEVAKVRGFTPANPAKLLILCPKSVIPHWQETIEAGIRFTRNLRIVILNYDQSLKLLTVPPKAQDAKKKATKNRHTAADGSPTIRWDIIVTDESHKLKNASLRSIAWDRIARAAEPTETAPFVIYASATIGQNPLELRYMASLFGQLLKRKLLSSKTWGDYLLQQGYHVSKGKVDYSWVKATSTMLPEEKEEVLSLQREDVSRLSRILFAPGAPAIRRSPVDIAGWPEIQRIAFPVSLEPQARHLYDEAWQEFRRELEMTPKGKNPKSQLVVRLRFQQKASLLLAPTTVDYIEDLVEQGYQVAVSTQFMETIDALKEGLSARKIASAEFSGRRPDREEERIRFQTGQVPVIMFTVTEGISLHANQQLPNGKRATSNPRATIIQDTYYTGIQSKQVEGRAHRDGEKSNAYYMYAEGTVQKIILDIMLTRLNNMKRLQGDAVEDTETLQEIEALLASYDEPTS